MGQVSYAASGVNRVMPTQEESRRSGIPRVL
jgi:hypothetical protein